MAPNLRLHRLSACHCGLPAHDCGPPSQHRSGGVPDWVHSGGPDAVFCDQRVKVGEVACFLVVHVLHEGSELWVGAHYGGRLGGIYEDGGKFASLVYADGAVEEVALSFCEGSAGRRGIA